MQRTREEILETRKRLRAEYGELYDCIAALLSLYDPMHLNFDGNVDEYEPETGTILPRLKNCHSVADVQRMVHEEFAHWFGGENVGTAEDYAPIAGKLWDLWLKSKIV